MLQCIQDIRGFNARVKLMSIKLANMDLIYWSDISFNKKGGNWVTILEEGYRYFSQLRVSLY